MEGQKWYHSCKQGQGNFIRFPVEIKCYDGEIRKVYTVGTSECRTCVCIYVRLSDKSCFIAHIAAELLDGDSDEVWQPNENQGNKLRQALVEKLQTYSELTALVNAKNYKLQDGDIALCSMLPDTVAGKTSVGKYLIQGLRDFFGNDIKAQWEAGFVVDHAARETHWIHRKWKEELHKDEVKAPEDAKFEDTEEARPRDFGWFCQNDEGDEWKGCFEWHFVWREGEWITDWVGR